MTKKKRRFSVGLNTICALLWTVNFLIEWREEGVLTVSTALFGLAAVCFAIAAGMGLIGLRRLREEEEE